MRAVFSAFVEQNAERAQELFDQVAEKDPAKALDLLARLAEYVVPKLARTELASSHDPDANRLDVNIQLVQPPPRDVSGH